jgi:oligopeptide transport system substrate-binding protein
VSDSRVTQLIQEAIVQRYSRRDILRRAAALGLSASAVGTLLAACGGGNAATPTAQTASSAAAGSGATPAVAAQPTAASQSAVAASGGTQILRRPGMEPMDFDTAIIGGGVGIEMFFFLFEGLTFYDWDQKKVLPAAAESWDVSDDKLTYTFHLRKGMVWSDGTPLTAHDFEYAIKRNLDPALGGTLTSFVFPIKGAQDYNTKKTTDPNSVQVTATDDLTLKMTLVGVTPYWPVILSLWTTFPINKKSVDKGGPKWTEPANIISNGRYTLDSWTHDQKMVLVRNEKYRGKKSAIDRIEYTLFQNPDAQGITAFQAGELDEANVIATSADFVTSNGTLSKLQRQVPISGTWQLRIDLSNDQSPLSKVGIRKALYLGIDRDLLCKKILKGLNTPALTLLPSDVPSYNPKAALTGTVADAKKYLADAGYPDGKNFPGFKLGYVPTQATAQLVSEALLQMWKDNLGITTATAFAVPTDWRKRIKTEKYDMYLGDWQSDFPDPFDWHNTIFDGDGWQTHWSDQKYLDMIKKASVEPDDAKRTQMYADAETYLIQDQMATIPLYVDGQLWVVQPWVQGLKVSPFDVFNFVDDATIGKH